MHDLDDAASIQSRGRDTVKGKTIHFGFLVSGFCSVSPFLDVLKC